MSELDSSIDAVKQEEHTLQNKHVRVKADIKQRKNPYLILLILLTVIALVEMNSILPWIFDIPEETIQADIIKLLKSTDGTLQNYRSTTGTYPDTLPADSPKWLIGYKKTLAGYKINTKIDDVLIELERRDEEVIVTRLD